jgi:hypothetical protein
MAMKKAKSTKNAKGAKMATKTTTKAKKSGAKASAAEREVVTIKPYEGPISIVPNDRAEAMEAQAEAVEGLGDEIATPAEYEAAANDLERHDGLEDPPVEDVGFGDKLEEDERTRLGEAGPSRVTTHTPEPAPAADETDKTADAERLLRDLGFERTGKIIEEVSAKALHCAAETWRDRKDRESRIAAADVVSRAGWFRAPDAAPAAPATETPAPTATAPAPTPTVAPPDLAALRDSVEDAKVALATAEADAKRLEEEARAAIARAKEHYRAALAPYRDACKVQRLACEYEGGGRGANVSERVTFEVALVGESVRIAVKDRPETEETIPVAEVRAALNKTAYGYTDRHVGLREVVGNKGGTLSNKLRAIVGA